MHLHVSALNLICSFLSDTRLLTLTLRDVAEALRGGWIVSSKDQRRRASPDPPSSESPMAEGQVSRDIQDHIGRHLRAMYDQLRTEPVPDRLLDLLKRLAQTGPM